MTSHIPLALSILGTLANAYPLSSATQKSAPPPPPPSIAPQAPQNNPSTVAAPVNVPSAQPSSTANGSSNTTTTLGASPPSIKPVALCDVSNEIIYSLEEVYLIVF